LSCEFFKRVKIFNVHINYNDYNYIYFFGFYLIIFSRFLEKYVLDKFLFTIFDIKYNLLIETISFTMYIVT